MVMRDGSFRCRPANVAIRLGIVALNNIVWTVSGTPGQDLLDVLGKAHVEHLVGLVQHHGLERRQVQRAPGQVIHGPARRGDHDVHAATQLLQLSADRLPAVDREHPCADGLAVGVDGLGNPAWPVRGWGPGSGRSDGPACHPPPVAG